MQLSWQERETKPALGGVGDRSACAALPPGEGGLGPAVLLAAHMAGLCFETCSVLRFFVFLTKYNLTVKKQTLKSSEVARRIHSSDK